jgi:hypothetical protein
MIWPRSRFTALSTSSNPEIPAFSSSFLRYRAFAMIVAVVDLRQAVVNETMHAPMVDARLNLSSFSCGCC